MEYLNTRLRCTRVAGIALFLSLFLLVACDNRPATETAGSSPASVSIEAPSENLYQQRIAEHFSSVAPTDGPGFAYLVVSGKSTLASGATGWANIEEQKQINSKTKFRIGSITKPFTAVAVLQLGERGKLTLDDPISRYFEGFPNGSKITLRHLLAHTSGIVDVKREDLPFKLDEPFPMEEHLALIKAKELAFEPGEQWSYINTGYLLLGLVVEQVSGQSLQNYMEEHIFEPLNMQDTVLYDNATTYENAAVGYDLLDGEYIPALDMHSSNWGGAAAGLSTVEDLHKWNVGLNTGKLLNADSYRQATTPVQFAGDYKPFVAYGFGLAMEEIAEVATIGHLGHQFGYHADVLWLPDEQISYVMLSNMNQHELKNKERAAITVLDVVLNSDG